MFQAIKNELSAARSMLSSLRGRIAAGEAAAVHDLHAIEQRIEAAFGHAEAGAAQDAASPVSSTPSGAAPSLDTSEPEAKPIQG